MTRRRAAVPATTAEFRRRVLRAAYIARFVEPRQMQYWLAKRSWWRRDQHGPALAALREIGAAVAFGYAAILDAEGRSLVERLVADVDQIVAWLKLTRLPGDEAAELRANIADWLLAKAPASKFAAYAVRFSGAAPDIGDVEGEPRPLRDGLVEVDRRPAVRIALDDVWYPEYEPRAQARDRLLRLAAAAIDEELDRIEAHAAALGVEAPDTRPRLERDLDWLVRHVRDRVPLARLAREDVASKGRLTVDAVRRAVRALADEVGVEL